MEPIITDPLFDLAGRVVVVTGANGQLGRSFTAALMRRGARVAALDLAIDSAAHAAYAGSPEFWAVAADVADRASLEAALAEIAERLGTPWGLVNNAAIDSPPDAPAEENGPFETFPRGSLDQVLTVNTIGVVQCCQVFGGAMAAAGGGSIVNIGSIYGVLSPDQRIYEYRAEEGGAPFVKPVGYAVSKSALYNLTRYLATYWARAGVRTNILTPAGVFNNQDEQFLKGYLDRMPAGRMADSEDYVGALVYLLSDASRYMTGAEMRVDGGWSAW